MKQNEVEWHVMSWSHSVVHQPNAQMYSCFLYNPPPLPPTPQCWVFGFLIDCHGAWAVKLLPALRVISNPNIHKFTDQHAFLVRHENVVDTGAAGLFSLIIEFEMINSNDETWQDVVFWVCLHLMNGIITHDKTD